MKLTSIYLMECSHTTYRTYIEHCNYIATVLQSCKLQHNIPETLWKHVTVIFYEKCNSNISEILLKKYSIASSFSYYYTTRYLSRHENCIEIDKE